MPILSSRFLQQLDDDSRSTHWLILLLVFSIGLALRIYAWYFGHAYHYTAINDELVAYEYALRFLAGDSNTYYLAQPLFSGGHAPGPLWTLYTALLLKLGAGSMHYALLWMTLINASVIILIYLFSRWFVLPRYALLISLVYATAPWTIYYSLGYWNPIPLDLIGILLFMSLWKTITANQSKYVFFVCLFGASIPQFHMIGLFYYPAIIWLLLLHSRQINQKWLLLGILAGFSLYLPYLIGDYLHDWSNTRLIFNDPGRRFSFSVLKIMTAPATVLSSVPSPWISEDAKDLFAYGDRFYLTYIVLVIITAISFFMSFVYLVYFIRQGKNSLRYLFNRHCEPVSKTIRDRFISILLLVPPLLFLITGHNYASRYTILIFPLLFLLVGIYFSQIHSARVVRLSSAYATGILVFNIYLVLTIFYQQNDLFNSPSQFMPSFKQLEKHRQALYRDLPAHSGISLRLADEYQNCDERERKTAYTLVHYIDLYNRYVAGDTPKELRKYVLFPSRSAAQLQSEYIVYRNNGIIIAAIP